MKESEFIHKNQKDPCATGEFHDFVRLAPNVFKASRNGKYFLLKTAADQSSAAYELLRREYEVSCLLQHPFIVMTIDFISDPQVGPAIVMEYVEGITLREFMIGNPSVSTKKKVLGQILDAVEYLHIKGLVHNDLKPDNIMVTAIGNDVKIIDFGLSETASDYLNRRLGGTRGATAPEIFDGNQDSPSKAYSDIYSIGVIMAAIFPQRYASIVRKCKRSVPEKRYADIAALRRAILRRNRRPLVLALSALIPLFVALAIVPDILRVRAEREEERLTREKVAKVQHDMEIMCQEALDSISNPAIVSRLDDSYPIMQNFVMRFVHYRDHVAPPDMRITADSVYSRVINILNTKLLEFPLFETDVVRKKTQ